jgi:hypothetical protein
VDAEPLLRLSARQSTRKAADTVPRPDLSLAWRIVLQTARCRWRRFLLPGVEESPVDGLACRLVILKILDSRVPFVCVRHSGVR